MTDWKVLYGYDPFGGIARGIPFILLLLISVIMLPMTAVLFAYGSPWFVLTLALGSLAFCGIVKLDKLEAIGRSYLYRVPRKYAATVDSAYYRGWRQQLVESPRAAVFAKSFIENDYATCTEREDRDSPRVLANGDTYWGFFHDNDERIDNPFHAAWLVARVLDEKNEPWASMPRLIEIASKVCDYVVDREHTGASTVASLTMAWFYGGMSDDEAEAVLADRGPELARLLFEGVPVEYASEML